MMDTTVALYREEDTFRVFVLGSTVSSFQNYPAKSSDARLEGGCFFFCVSASAQRGKLPWVSWLHIRRMNELNWKTNSLQRRNVFLLLLILGQIHFYSHIYRVKDLRSLMSLNLNVELMVFGSGEHLYL